MAIKILKESRDPETTKEFFDEAVVMARLDHKHLVRILCLCAGKKKAFQYFSFWKIEKAGKNIILSIRFHSSDTVSFQVK